MGNKYSCWHLLGLVVLAIVSSVVYGARWVWGGITGLLDRVRHYWWRW
jgi:hypothetical protein